MSIQTDALVMRLAQQVQEQGERVKALEIRVAYLERELENRPQNAPRQEKRLNGTR